MIRISNISESQLLLPLQAICAASAIGSLPRGAIHPVWILSFVFPTAVLLLLGRGAPGRFLPLWVRFGLATITQAAAAYLTYRYVGPLNKEPSLACSLLPFLTFFTLRREPSDTSLSLFLSFCFLLIGIMLNNGQSDWTLLVFLVACSWALQIEASQRALAVRHAARGPGMSWASKLLRRTQVIAAMMMAAFLIYQGIDLLPSPGRTTAALKEDQADHQGRNRVVGLSSRFDLSGTEGVPINLADDESIVATDPSGKALPDDLYLRTTYYDRPSSAEWYTWPPDLLESNVDPRRFYLWEPVDRGLKRYRLAIRRLVPPQEGELYLPPGAERVIGIRRMIFDKRSGYYRSADPEEEGYQVDYRRPHELRLLQGIDPTLTKGGTLTALPPAYRTQQFRDLARELGGRDAKRMPPMELARHIAAELGQRCSYVLREPEGGYDDAVSNFLFSCRTGYCMHFAAATVVLLRLNGVPSRVAVGLQGGERLDGSPGRVFGSRHAHAWVELPLRRTGWTLVDPTPPADRSQLGWPENTPGTEEGIAAAAPIDETTEESCFFSGLSDPLANPGAMLTLVIVFVGVSLTLMVYLLRRASLDASRSGGHRATADAVRARRLLEQILRALAKGGYPKHRFATLEQYLRALHREGDTPDSEGVDVAVLAGAFRAYQDVRFGAKELDEDRETRLATGVAVARRVT